MRQLIQDFLTLNARNSPPFVYVGLGLVYFAMLFFTITSIAGQARGISWKFSWTIACILLPVVGMTAYALQCIWTADHSWLRMLGFGKSSPRQLKKAV